VFNLYGEGTRLVQLLRRGGGARPTSGSRSTGPSSAAREGRCHAASSPAPPRPRRRGRGVRREGWRWWWLAKSLSPCSCGEGMRRWKQGGTSKARRAWCFSSEVPRTPTSIIALACARVCCEKDLHHYPRRAALVLSNIINFSEAFLNLSLQRFTPWKRLPCFRARGGAGLFRGRERTRLGAPSLRSHRRRCSQPAGARGPGTVGRGRLHARSASLPRGRLVGLGVHRDTAQQRAARTAPTNLTGRARRAWPWRAQRGARF
jgi:hypothetical protein